MHLFWQVLNLAILISIIIFFLRKPLSRYLGKRSLDLRDNLREAYSADDQGLARLALVDAQIENLSLEIAEIKEKAKKDSQEQREKVLKEAEQEYQRLLSKAQEDIEHEFKESQKRIKAFTVDKAINYAEQQIVKDLSEELHNRLIEDYIERLSLRYASGLIKAASAQRQLSDMRFQIERFLKLMVHHPLFHHPEVKRILLDQSISPLDKQRILDSIFKRLDLGDLVKNFLLLLIRKGRMEQLHKIFLSSKEEIDSQDGAITAEVTAARGLSSSQQERLRTKLSELTGCPIKLDLKVSPEIIGGTITKIGSVIYDGSIKHQLQRLKKSIIEE